MTKLHYTVEKLLRPRRGDVTPCGPIRQALPPIVGVSGPRWLVRLLSNPVNLRETTSKSRSPHHPAYGKIFPAGRSDVGRLTGHIRSKNQRFGRTDPPSPNAVKHSWKPDSPEFGACRGMPEAWRPVVTHIFPSAAKRRQQISHGISRGIRDSQDELAASRRQGCKHANGASCSPKPPPPGPECLCFYRR
jgi:hypothetical protein